MANILLTPVTLWRDFDDSLPTGEEVISTAETENAVLHEVYFLGRQTNFGRVKIYAQYFTPKGHERYPAVMIFFEAGFPFDEKLVNHFLERGYAVLCVDYCGDKDTGRHTIYPRDIDYANYVRAGRAMTHADNTAKETSWYEWAAVARYAAKYLAGKAEVTKTGALGLRTGGEVLWKIAPYAPISCFVSVCAAGWLAYRDVEKFGAGTGHVFDEERHRFIAGIDSQSYAPHVKCPVLILSAVNDKKSNYDRVYDTFQQINPDVEKAILYASHGNGLMGRHTFVNMDMFFDKFLRGRSVYVSKPVSFSTFVEDGNLKVKGIFDPEGDPKEFRLFYSEKIDGFKARDWTRVDGSLQNVKGNEITFPLDVFVESKKVVLYILVRYSNGFTVTSKIHEIALNNPYKNSRARSRILFSGKEGVGFAVFRRRASSIADCFFDGSHSGVTLLPGYGGILGASSANGLISYRVSEPRYEALEGACFQFDAYCASDSTLTVIFYTDAEETKGYSCTFPVSGGGKWKNFLCTPDDFKSETGLHLPNFTDVVSVVFLGEGDVLVNNVKWL